MTVTVLPSSGIPLVAETESRWPFGPLPTVPALAGLTGRVPMLSNTPLTRAVAMRAFMINLRIYG
ncbi:hypothetical protein Jiend_56760 [Micromonospora endophytica]|uniref:hypothetical protein n=1 Tax=Micromonospora endophytica TaxID=515350 RepID=UPI001C3368DE|nr:hypothetical protein [Micromonospora endophytica]BCJ62254.1 hypothetical protein Jiend_56760 [Micromonospora endophytica]